MSHFYIHASQLSQHVGKSDLIQLVEKQIHELGFIVKEKNDTRPWGVYFTFQINSLPAFINEFYHHLDIDTTTTALSPKLLIIDPGHRLSWQYHNRRVNIWKVIAGEVAIPMNWTDREMPGLHYYPGEVVTIPSGMRHRLTALDTWAIIAEIWQHTDPHNLSNEEDIIRLSDDYGRADTS